MSRTLQFKRYSTSQLANTIGANGELIIDNTTHGITVHDGQKAGGYRFPSEQTSVVFSSDTGRFSVNNQPIGAITANTLTLSGGININNHTYINDIGLIVSGPSTLGTTTINGTLTVNGNTNFIFSNNTVMTDHMLELHSVAANVATPWTYNDGKDIGFRFHYFDGTDKNASLYMDNGNHTLKWVVNGSEAANGNFIDVAYGNFQANNINASGVIFSDNTRQTTAYTVGVQNLAQAAFNKANTVLGNLQISGENVSTTNTNANVVISTIHVNPSASPAINAVNSWEFRFDGNLKFPDNTYQYTAFTDAINTQINTNSANTVYIQGVDATQNTNITTVDTKAQAAFDSANVIVGVNTTQNTNITNATTLAQAAFNQANTAANTASGGGLIATINIDSTNTTITTASSGGFVTLAGTTCTVTLPDPTTCSGANYTFWQNTSSQMRLFTPAGAFYGPAGSASDTKVLLQTTTQHWRVVSDGTSWILFAIRAA
jgi:hypothetical protein